MKKCRHYTILFLFIICFAFIAKSQTRIEKKFENFDNLVQTMPFTKALANKQNVMNKDSLGISIKVSSLSDYISFVQGDDIDDPCFDCKILENVCLHVDSRTKNLNSKSDYTFFMYQQRFFDAACVNVEKDNEETIGFKIRFIWNKCWDKLMCQSVQFDESGSNILKFAVSSKFDEFLYDFIDWKVDLNKVDFVDNRTVLDYVMYQIEKHKGTSIESKLRHYYKILRQGGAKHRFEL